MKGLLYLLGRTVYFLNCVSEMYSTYSIYLAFWQTYDLTIETNLFHFPKSANTMILNKRKIQNALALIRCRPSHSLLEICQIWTESWDDTEWHWLIGEVERGHVMREREVRTACALKAANKRNAPKFVEWELVRDEVDVAFQECWSEEMQSMFLMHVPKFTSILPHNLP